MSYFDDPVHSTGALTTALSTHASDVKGVGRWQTVSVFFKGISYPLSTDIKA